MSISNEPPPGTLAVFDFDGTLLSNDSLFGFLRRVCGAGPLATAGIRAAFTFARELRPADRDVAKAKLLAAALGHRRIEDLAEVAERYASELTGRLRGDVVGRLRWHQHSGHRTVLLSASPHLYVSHVGAALAMDATVATQMEVGQDGRLTGSLMGTNVRGVEKVAALKQWLGGAEPRYIYAYGDSAGDLPLLRFADHGVRVSRRMTLDPAPALGEALPRGEPGSG